MLSALQAEMNDVWDKAGGTQDPVSIRAELHFESSWLETTPTPAWKLHSLLLHSLTQR